MDIKEFNELEIDSVDPEQFQDDPTIGELINKYNGEKQANDAIMGQYDMGDDDMETNEIYMNQMHEDSQAPEAKEFMGGEKLQSAGSENGLAGSVENGDGDKTPEPTEIQSLLDRMKELTKILTNKPDIQWNEMGGGVVDKVKEVSPDDVVRSVSTTGAPSIQTLKNPEAVSTSGTTDKKENPFAKKEDTKEEKENPTKKKENPFAKKEDAKEDDEDDEVNKAVNEIHTHHLGANKRHVSGNEEDLNEEEDEEMEEVVESDELNDDEILESDNTELMYEAMVRAKNDPSKFLKFKRQIDIISKSRRLEESLAKMKNRF